MAWQWCHLTVYTRPHIFIMHTHRPIISASRIFRSVVGRDLFSSTCGNSSNAAGLWRRNAYLHDGRRLMVSSRGVLQVISCPYVVKWISVYFNCGLVYLFASRRNKHWFMVLNTVFVHPLIYHTVVTVRRGSWKAIINIPTFVIWFKDPPGVLGLTDISLSNSRSAIFFYYLE